MSSGPRKFISRRIRRAYVALPILDSLKSLYKWIKTHNVRIQHPNHLLCYIFTEEIKLKTCRSESQILKCGAIISVII